ncbi:MAG: laminin G [uncultured bacterium (gcode 4)]|uniref:Laminin G n=1 Tax=uncultured bacterium (gcode 4) TaxID=1234023 RepID=K2G1N3_9BACT|nr:MAG: laminin G [uncultured bacterium (gcode 4)]
MSTQNTKNNNAFTLVELIVVIVILAILATIAFLSFSSQSGSARDSTRLSDISSIKKSVEMYNVNAWTYPTPDYAYSYTYSGWTIWNQWTIWDSVYKMLQKNLSKKVVDPLKWSEYDYSLASNKREYQVAWNFENPTSFERNYNPFDSSALSPKLSALGWTGANVYISWNYNWVMLKVFTWSTYYFVPTPTLFWLNSWTWNVVYDNTFWSWKDLLPWVNNVAVFDSSKIYASTSSTWLSSAEVTSLMNTVQLAYSGWNVTTPAVQAVLAATWSALTDLWNWIVKNNLGGGAISIAPPSPDLPIATPVITVWTWLLLHWDNLSNPLTFIDSSATSKTMTTNWDARQIGKFWGMWYFDWSTSNLSMPDSEDWNFWTGNFTIEAWLSTRVDWSILGQWTWNGWSNYHYWINLIVYNGKLRSQWWLWVWNVPSPWLMGTIPVADWKMHHVVLVRNNNSLNTYVDWVLDWTYNFTWVNIYNDNSVFRVWQANEAAETSWPRFFIDELRISKWVARFTWDFSSSLPTSPYTADANDVLLLHFDWTGNSFDDSSTTNRKTITVNWATQVSPKIWSWLMAFDWAWDYLTAPNNWDANFWTWSFTIDTWVYLSPSSWSWPSIFDWYNSNWDYMQSRINSDWTLNFIARTGWASVINVQANSAVPLNAWTHVAFVKYWTGYDNFKIYVNWAEKTLTINQHMQANASMPALNSLLYVWKSSQNGAYLKWFLDELRVTKWIAMWASDFTPPTAPY